MADVEVDAQAAAQASVQAYCGWHIAPSLDEELILDGPGSGSLMLPSLLVTDVGSISENGTILDPDSDYTWSASGVIRRTYCGHPWMVDHQPRWTNAHRAIVVNFSHGYADWPLEIQAVIDRLASRALEGASVLSQVGAVAYATGPDGMPPGGTLTASERTLLALYKLPHRP